MPIIWTGDEEHACTTCGHPCDCDDAQDCRGCWYCIEEAHDASIRDTTEEEPNE